MQFPRSTIQSLPETFEFDHASSSNNSGLSQQLFWNSVLNPADTRNMQEYQSSRGTTTAYANTVNHDIGGITGWNPAGPSSSGHVLNQTSHREAVMDQELMDSVNSHSRASVRLVERNFEPANSLSSEGANIDLNNNQIANGPFIQNSSSNETPQNANLGAGYVANVGNVLEAGVSHYPYKTGGSETGQISSAGGFADPCATTSGTAENQVNGSDGRPGCSVDGRRLSCKRKAIEGVSGPSYGGSSNCFQQAESSAHHAFPSRQNASGTLSISSSVEQLSSVNPQDELLNPQLDGMRVAPDCYPTSTGNESVENSQRNFRMRINHANQVFAQPNLWHSGNTIRHSLVRQQHQSSSRLLISNQSLDLTQGAATTQTPSFTPHFPGLPHNMHPLPWVGTPDSRVGSSSNSLLTLGERSSILREEANSRNIPRSISEHPMFVPATETRNLTQDQMNWSLTNGSVPGTPSVPGSASSSRTGSSSGVNPLPVTSWVPQQHLPTRYIRRPSEVARRSLFSPAGSESGALGSSFQSSRTVPASSQEMVLPSEAGNRGHPSSYLRSAFLLDRVGDGALGVPLSLRALTSASEGRSRLASELRSVLELIRRGENLRLEDVLVFEHSVIFGAPDLHDRHRDMRLDVDNMSYEELLALEERIGNVNTGLIEETILKCLKQHKYASNATGEGTEVEPCCICQEEYVGGEDLGTLDCGHEFHTGCIKQWLMLKNLCPICKTTALVT